MTAARDKQDGRDGDGEQASYMQSTLPGNDTPTTLPGSGIGPSRTNVGPATDLNLRNAAERYCNFRTIGTGGIGIVTSCEDPNLGRRVAVKTLRAKYANMESLRRRFVREARVMSQLEHPNIVPVHELGQQPDGTIYFTMKQVRGESLEFVLQRLEDGDSDYLRDYPDTRLMDIFGHICQATAFAHSRGVIHRDLKPENIMIGAFGEVQIMDWGLLKVMADSDANDAPSVSHGGDNAPEATLEGQIAGTPLYMSPEQASGHIDQLDQRSDLYALGAILYRILTHRRYVIGEDVPTILKLVQEKLPTPPHRLRTRGRRVSRELSAICMKALAKRREERYQSVQEMIDDLERHERGLPVAVCREPLFIRLWKLARRHPIASVSSSVAIGFAIILALVAGYFRHQRYRDLLATAGEHKARGDQLATEMAATQIQLNAIRKRRHLRMTTPREDILTKRLERLRTQNRGHYDIARLLYAQAVPLAKSPVRDFLELIRLPGMSRDAPTTSERYLDPVMRGLVDTYRRQIDCALLTPDYAEARRLTGMMDNWILRTPGGYETSFRTWRGGVQRSLDGYGALRAETEDTRAEIRLYRLTPDHAAPLPEQPDRRGWGGLGAPSLARGSYLLVVTATDREPVPVPFHIARDEPHNIRIHVPEEIPPGMVYVHAGETTVGGENSPLYRSGKRHVAGFFIKTHEVTFAEYLEFWRQVGDEPTRDRLMARVQFKEGAYCKMPAWDSSGELERPLTPDLPVVGIDKQAADAYCRWRSAREGREVRLPTADEWEKAARGADGRRFPWGNDFSWEYAHLEQDAFGQPSRTYARPGTHPIDRSVYGVMDMAGNVREWTTTPFPDSPRRFQIKGGSLATSMRSAACAHADGGEAIPTDIGFRFVMPLNAE